MKKFTLVHETPSHFVLHNGEANFHIAKNGLGKDMIQKIKQFADGGQVESEADKMGKSIPSNVDPDKAAAFKPFDEGGQVESEADKMGKSIPSNVDPNKAAAFKPFDEGGEVEPQKPPKKEEVEKMGQEVPQNVSPVKAADFHPFADGGEVDTQDNDAPLKEMQDQADSYEQVMKDFQEFRQNKYKGGKVQHYDKGTTDVQPMEVNVSPAEAVQAQGGPAAPANPQALANAQQSAEALSNSAGVPMPEMPTQPGQTVPPEQQVSFVPPQIPGASSPSPQPKNDLSLPQNINEAEQMEAAGVGKAAEAQAKAASQTAQTMSDFYKQQANNQAVVNEHLKSLDAQNDQLFTAATTNKIDPNHLWNSSSTPAKISAALGLVLGGIGSGLTGQPNQAAHFIENAINRDVEAQRLNMGNANNAYKMGLERYKDTQSAANFATMQANTLVAAKLQQIAANSQNPAIIGAAQKQIADIYTKMAPLKMELAQRSLALQLTSGGAMKINPEGLAPEYRERSVQLPNGQIALAPTKEDATTVKKALNSYGNIDKQLTDMYNTLKQEGRSVNPLGSYAAKSASMRDNVILELNHLHDLNRLNEREFDTYKKMVPGPGDLLQDRAVAKIMQLKNIIKGHTNSEYAEHLTNYAPPQIQTAPPVFNQPVDNKQFNKIGR